MIEPGIKSPPDHVRTQCASTPCSSTYEQCRVVRAILFFEVPPNYAFVFFINSDNLGCDPSLLLSMGRRETLPRLMKAWSRQERPARGVLPTAGIFNRPERAGFRRSVEPRCPPPESVTQVTRSVRKLSSDGAAPLTKNICRLPSAAL